jgi:hypothetical protein
MDTFCNSCFEQLPEAFDASFCPSCGQKVSGEASKPKRKAPARKRRVSKPKPTPAPKPTPKPAPKPAAPAPVASSEPVSDWALCVVLLASAIAIRLQGRYRKTSEANSTKGYVSELIFSRETDKLATPADRESATATAAWIDALEGATDYEDSLIQAVKRARRDGEVDERDLGRLASAVASAQRAAQREQDREKRATEGPAKFAGIEGARGRQDLGTVTIEETRYMQAYDNWLVKGRLVAGPFEGARVAWFDRGSEPEKGLTAALNAKVKKHNARFGETQISYVRLS